VAVGLLAAATLACLAVLGPPVARLSASGPRVVAAVRDGYPELCHEWRDKVVAQPSPASFYTSWDVSCEAGFRPLTYALMTVNVVTCSWREPLKLSLDWHKMLATLTAASQRLRRCP
jgi:hypothetical protein